MISFEGSKRIWVSSIFCVAVLALQPAYSDPGRGTLYGTNGGDGDTITVNPLTGAGTVVGPSDVGATPSLAVDPTTGIIYGGQGSGEPNLHTVNPLTGAWTLVGVADPECGNTNLGFAAIGGMDFRADGTLFAAVNIAGDGGTGSDHLAILDKASGLATVIGPFGSCTGVETECTSGTGSCTLEGMEAIAFDENGTLWGALSARGASGTPGLYTIDPATGSATFVAQILDGEESIPDGGIVSLQFECDGTLLGGTARAFGESIGGRLGTIDTSTGLFTSVGFVSATGGSSLAALGYDTPCPQRPVCTGSPITDPVGVAGTTTDDDGIATIELDEDSTNLVLDVEEFEAGASTVLFTVAPDISGSDAEGSVIVTDVTGLTCQLPVSFTGIPAGPTDEEVICSGEGILLEVSNPLSTEGGGAICSGSEFTDEEPDLPPGVDPSPDGDPTLCRVLTIISPISGETVMVYKKDGTFEPRLRLFIAEFDGFEFEDFKDVTESVIEIADIIPDPTRLEGRGKWSTVKITCAILSEVCNGLDDDGDGLIDEDLPVGDPTVDADGDGFPLCPAAGQVGDCSDTNPNINPGRIEDCDNGLDDNCNGLLDQADPQCDFLLVELSSFTASGGPAGVLLEWTTISEIDNEGFRVLRARGDGEPVLLTPDLIPARGGLFQTTHYEYLDAEWQLPGTVLYYLEDVDSTGTVTRHGPVQVRIRRPVGVKPKGRPEGR